MRVGKERKNIEATKGERKEEEVRRRRRRRRK